MNKAVALSYALKGWHIIPVWPLRRGACACQTACGKSAGKHPLSALVPRGSHDSSCNPEVVERWWDQWPDANIGIVTGEKSGLFVVDVDIIHGGHISLQELITEHTALPDTLRSQTAHMGSHLFFKHPGLQVRNLVDTLAHGIDVRGDGGYVVAPPSIIGEDKVYRWIDESKPVLDAPQWLVDRVTGVSANRDPVETATILNGVPEGQRDMTLFRLVCKFRAAGIPREFAEDLAVMAARKCEPPFDEGLAREKVERVYRSYQQVYAMTDVGNAERLIDRHGGVVRYTESDLWYVWDGSRWNGDRRAAIINLAQEVTVSTLIEARQIPATDDAARERRDLLIKWAYASQNVNRINAMIELARADSTVQIMIDDFDSDPYLLGVPNGTLDLRSGTLRAHSRGDFITKLAKVPYSDTAVSPKLDHFLEDIFPDPELRLFVQTAAGYSLTGSVGEQCLFFCYGTGANGKSTLLNIMLNLMGSYAKAGVPDMLMASRNDSHPTVVAELVGARFIPTIEAEQGRRLAEAHMKWLTGGDRLKARRMHENYFEYTPHFKLWLAANHKPLIYGTDNAVWRRIFLIPFTVSIPPEKRIKDYDKVLIEEEGPGILKWLVDGARRWLAHGLQPPEAVRAATQAYRSDMDILGQFLAECVEPDVNSKLLSNDLFAAYSAWTKDAGEYTEPQRKFTAKVTELGYAKIPGAGGRNSWVGIRLTAIGRDYMAMGIARNMPTGDVSSIIDLRKAAQQ